MIARGYTQRQSRICTIQSFQLYLEDYMDHKQEFPWVSNAHWVMNSNEKPIMKLQCANTLYFLHWIQTPCLKAQCSIPDVVRVCMCVYLEYKSYIYSNIYIPAPCSHTYIISAMI